MASKAKAEANRRNAARSTGPRSAQGKSSSAQNARRHGFAGGNAIAQSMESEKIERLACAIAGTDQDPHRLYYARVIAETQLRLALIAKAKIKLIVLVMYRLPAMRTLEPRLCLAVLKSLERLRRLERYERRAFSRCSQAIRRINN